jgi:uncharacterized protein YbjT (DUF2867 family)
MTGFLVTGATGQVGRLVAAELATTLNPAQNTLRLLVRQPRPTPATWGTQVVGDLADLPRMAQVFAGMDTVFMYTPAVVDEQLLQVAASQGVRHVVLLSSASVVKVPPSANNPVAERHRRMEQAVKAAGIALTTLRPDTMASNCLQWAPGIRRSGCVRAPYPMAMRNPVHEADIALVATLAMRNSKAFQGQAYTLTGPACLTLQEQVESIARATGRPLVCQTCSPTEALREWVAGPPGVPQAVAERLLAYMEKCTRVVPETSPDFQLATGQTARSFERWAQDHATDFLAPAPPPP